MRMLSRCLLLLLFGAAAGCDKSGTPVQGGFVPPPRKVVPVVENYCLVATARTVDTTFSAVQLMGPDNGWDDEVAWGLSLTVPGVQKNNYHCVKVFVAQAGTGLWREVPNADKNPDGATVMFWVLKGSHMGGISLWSGDLQPQLGGVDLTKMIDVKVSYKVL